MAKYRPYDYDQMFMIPLRGRRPISLKDQLEPGTLEYAIHEVVEKKIDTSLRDRRSIFEKRFQNNETWSAGSGTQPQTETCDSLDHDCDAEVNEGICSTCRTDLLCATIPGSMCRGCNLQWFIILKK